MSGPNFKVDRVLLTNDDGIDSPGLNALEKAVSAIAREVWVVAPVQDQSGRSHAMSLYEPLRVEQRGERRFAVRGTPADCVAAAIGHIMKERPNLVLSGINCGANLGKETVFSGTVGAAMTSMLLGIHGFALSQDFVDRNHAPWERAAENAAEVINRLTSLEYFEPVCLNVNFPSERIEEIRGVRGTTQGPGLLGGVEVLSRNDPRGIEYLWLRLMHEPHCEPTESESSLLEAGYLTVTPLQFERTDQAVLAMLRKSI
jgi:5'-nucleotidase